MKVSRLFWTGAQRKQRYVSQVVGSVCWQAARTRIQVCARLPVTRSKRSINAGEMPCEPNCSMSLS